MIESPVYEQILKEGIEKGEEKALKNNILAVLEMRFGVVPEDMEESVRSLKDLKQLEALLRQAVVVKDLGEFHDFLKEEESSCRSHL